MVGLWGALDLFACLVNWWAKQVKMLKRKKKLFRKEKIFNHQKSCFAIF